jgi:signal transduction histidine kinase
MIEMPSSAQDDLAAREQIAHWRHELLTLINHILGYTGIQIEEAPEAGLADYVPAFREINSGGQALLAIIEDELAAHPCASDFQHMSERLECEAAPALGLARKLVTELRAIGRGSVAQEAELVLRALESLLSMSNEMVRDRRAPIERVG